MGENGAYGDDIKSRLGGMKEITKELEQEAIKEAKEEAKEQEKDGYGRNHNPKKKAGTHGGKGKYGKHGNHGKMKNR